ncbi:MAG TPA: hypothetical protein ENH82_08380 [bacterium]|nr:hypothetical protein [bacterium]
MRNYDKYRSTKFIQKSDVERGILVTIDKVTEENVAPDWQPEERKYVIHFQEDYKAWAPGIEVLETIKQIAGTGNVDDWSGTKLVLFVDLDVKFGSKKVGGIRCRVPKNQPETQQDKPVYQKNPDYVGDLPEGICPHCQNPLENCSCEVPF